ncbi:acyltransferase family protein [uncultured Algibacter sp.]|uniref:acyltransferase family protein n=1 Tax=uncultured Algibacter sp. TaxID=298659 RepID=UPI00262CBB96|nr:acyltransferase family protein [uncultured Algibacter sp.]
MNDRYEWVDQARGLGIFLVIYGHNYPFLESYIYSFHMPLFFFIAGMFHPKNITKYSIVKRAKSILIPYFIWSLLLYIFWLFLGRHFGNSTNYNLDPLQGFIGVFYAQGDVQFMDWGIPMWFLPCIFLTFLLFSFVNKIRFDMLKGFVLIILVTLGLVYPVFFEFKLPWSIDVACVSLIFYSAGSFLKNRLIELRSAKKLFLLTVCCLLLSVSMSMVNSKIDMYRSQYGNIALFILNGFMGTLFVLFLFKWVKFPKIVAFLGRNTIPLLALQFRSLTIIKLILIVIGINTFTFSEPIKLILAFVQVLLIIPVIIFVNKYMPILNGRNKK